jgi:hypothetical protein
MKKILTLVVLLAGTTAIAQHEFSSFTATGRGGATSFVTDYQAVGINPANLGWTWKFEEKKVAFGMMDNTFSIHSDALAKKELRQEFWSATKGWINAENKDTNTFTYDEKVIAAKDFSDAGFSINADMGILGAAFTHDKIGGFAFRINSHNQWHSKLGKNASEILFLGRTAPYFDSLTIFNGVDTTTILNDPNAFNLDSLDIINGFASAPKLISELLDGSLISFSSYVDYNLSYGRKIFEIDSVFALYGGVGFKYIQGLGYLEIESKDGELFAFSSLSPAFRIDYGDAASLNPSTVTQDGSFPPKMVGRGFGFDIGINAVLFNKLKVAAAFTNAGTVTWDGNVYTVKDTLLFDTESVGAESYNFFQQVDEFSGDNGLLEWQGLSSRKVALPSVFRFGASMEFGKIAEVGFDAIFPANQVAGSFEKPILGLGGDLRPLPWLQLSAGFMTGGNYDFMVPVGLTLITGGGSYEFGIASRDAVTFFAKNGPTISWSVGFLRFRI